MKKYEKPEIEITVFDSVDIIMGSGISLHDDEIKSPIVDETSSSMLLNGDGSNELIASPTATGEGSVSEEPSGTNGEQVDTPLVDTDESAGPAVSEPVVEEPVSSADNTDVPEIAQEDSASVAETVETPVD